jgi:hypothetical protein
MKKFMIFGVLLVLTACRTTHSNQTGSSNETSSSNFTEGYHASNEVISPYEISRNPYKFKGRSGIIDTLRIHYSLGSWGDFEAHSAWNLHCLRFEKMIDEHTAIYSLLAVGGLNGSEVITDGEIAVILPDNDPPKLNRSWQVFVEGTMQAVNGLGNIITLTAVRFEGYSPSSLAEPTRKSSADSYQTPKGPKPATGTPPNSYENPNEIGREVVEHIKRLSDRSAQRNTEQSSNPGEATTGQPSAKGSGNVPSRPSLTKGMISAVHKGQSSTVVQTILGPPVSVTLGAKHIYFYPNLKVVFVDGKVSEIIRSDPPHHDLHNDGTPTVQGTFPY